MQVKVTKCKVGFSVLIFVVLLAMFTSVGCASAKTWYVDDDGEADFTGIQDAVNAVNARETIIVRNGTYIENVDLYKRLTIQSENGPDSTIVRASNPKDSVFYICNDYVTVSGFTVTGATEGRSDDISGIHIENVAYCNISNNNVSNNRYGITLHSSSNNNLSSNTATSNNKTGFYLSSSSNNKLTNNNVSDNGYGGIKLLSSSNNNTLTNNNVFDNSDGIQFRDSNRNTMVNNNLSRNTQHSFGVSGDKLSYFIHRIDASNKIDEKPMYYWVNERDKKVPGDAGYVGIVNSTNIIVKDLKIEKNEQGILLVYSRGSRIENVGLKENDGGIILRHSSNSIIANSSISDNVYGIKLYDSGNSTLANNIIKHNKDGIRLRHSSNCTILNNTVRSNDPGSGIFITSRYGYGIDLDSSSHCIIANNRVEYNWDGIELYNSCNSSIVNNDIFRNKPSGLVSGSWSEYCGGIELEHSSNSIIANNRVRANWYGIELQYSSNCIMENNNISENSRHNFGVSGVTYTRSHYIHTIDASNKIDEKPMYYWVNERDKKVPGDAGYVGIVNSTNIIVKDLKIEKNEQGILLAYSSDSRIENVSVTDNEDGIELLHADNNTIANSNLSDNEDGISFYSSSNNKIYLNNFVDNKDNVYTSHSTNIWNSPEEINYTINGTSSTSYLGNCWDDYEEKYPDADEIDATCIWDTPYSIDGDKDNYPLMESFENYLRDFVSHSSTLNVSVTVAIDPVAPGNYSQVTVRVTTTEGTPLSDASVSVSQTGGSLSPTSGTTDSKGEFKSTYTAPSVTTTQTYTISATASKASYISGFGSDTITINYEPRRLLTGTFLVKKLSGGRGELIIENGLSSDAVVVLSKSTRPKIALMSVYLHSENTYTITGIPDGVYILYYSFGEDWDSNSKKFTVTQTYGRFKEELEFKTTTTGTHIDYTGYAATLHPVPGGTAKTEHVSEADFPE